MTAVRLRIDDEDATPIYAQLERGLRAAIGTGTLKAGEQLPTVRQLAVQLRVNANTVARVYAALERDGIVATKRGVGTFVAEAMNKAWSPGERSRHLRAFALKLVSDSVAAGLTIEEIVAETEEVIREGAARLVSKK